MSFPHKMMTLPHSAPPSHITAVHKQWNLLWGNLFFFFQTCIMVYLSSCETDSQTRHERNSNFFPGRLSVFPPHGDGQVWDKAVLQTIAMGSSSEGDIFTASSSKYPSVLLVYMRTCSLSISRRLPRQMTDLF